MTKSESTAFSREGGVLRITLPSRLDGSNAARVSAEIETHTSGGTDRIRLDAGNLRYITADGLDVILDLKKKYGDVAIDHAKMGICDTLEEYGFNFFVDIRKQYRFVSVEGCEVIGHGGHGTIYKVGADTIVKVYRDHSTLETIENERRYARNAFMNGIPTAIAYDVVETEFGYGVMFEMLDGTTLGRYLAEHPQELQQYGVRFADLLRKLNTTKADCTLYKDFHDVYLDRAECAKKFISEREAEEIKRVIRSIPRGGEMIHGDYHPNNVMVDSTGELLLIDMADISRGNGFFDIGGTSMIMDFLPRIPLVRRIVRKITSMEPKACLRMWEILVRGYYGTDDEELLKTYRERFRAFSRLRIAVAIGMKSSRPPIVDKLLTIYTKKVFAPKTERYIQIFSTMTAEDRPSDTAQ